MGQMSQYLLILALLLMGAIDQGFAQSTSPKEQLTLIDSQVKNDLQTFCKSWQLAHPQAPINGSALQLYAIEHREQNASSYARFAGKGGYQPLIILPSGAWVMGFGKDANGSIAAVLDLNGETILPDQSDIRILFLNAQGQVTGKKN